MTALCYGIDFGTSTSSLMVARPDGTTVAVRDPGSPARSASVPTSVCVLSGGRLVVGRAAENAKRLRPAAYRAEFKRDFGDPDPVRMDTLSLRPDELTTEVLRFLRELAADQAPGEAGHVVITVPAAWEAGRRDLMRTAAVRAGFDSSAIELVAEPVAALASAAGGAAGTTFLYDLGGGTFDCAVAMGDEASHEVLGAPGGLADLGGTEFDRILLRMLRERAGPAVAALLGGPAGDADVIRRRLSLKESCEGFKCQLSVAESHEDLFTELAPPVRFELTRADFERELRQPLMETLAECDRVLRDNGLSWRKIDRIVAVGGGSRMPIVTKLLAEHSGRPLVRVDEPELAICRGAAALALRRLPLHRKSAPSAVEPATGNRPVSPARAEERRSAEEPGCAEEPGPRRRPARRGLGLLSAQPASGAPRVKVTVRRASTPTGSWGRMSLLVDDVEQERLQDGQTVTIAVEPGLRRFQCRQYGHVSNVLVLEAGIEEINLVCRFKDLDLSSPAREKIVLRPDSDQVS